MTRPSSARDFVALFPGRAHLYLSYRQRFLCSKFIDEYEELFPGCPAIILAAGTLSLVVSRFVPRTRFEEDAYALGYYSFEPVCRTFGLNVDLDGSSVVAREWLRKVTSVFKEFYFPRAANQTFWSEHERDPSINIVRGAIEARSLGMYVKVITSDRETLNLSTKSYILQGQRLNIQPGEIRTIEYTTASMVVLSISSDSDPVVPATTHAKDE